MKQYITVEDLQMLEDKSSIKELEKWCEHKGKSVDSNHFTNPSGDKKTIVKWHTNIPLFSIGELIEFIDEHDPMRNNVLDLWYDEHQTEDAEFEDVELIDWLWMETMEALNETKP